MRNSRNSWIAMKKLYNFEKEVLKIRERSYETGIKNVFQKGFQKIKTGKINLSMWDARNSESGIKIFWKSIKEDLNEEFKKFKNCNEEILKFRKSGSQNKIKK